MDEDVDEDLPRSIGRPATSALRHVGYTRLEQLDGVPARDLLALHGVGPKAVRLLGEALAARGMRLG
ncbi:DNA-binding protein [Actinomycetospora straminea]|uniref:Helix-hairpin-helix protein n=1 Tax=Actinomycetospora straminea TaxID=663607 RepID=A0ABP9ERJ7_9PSEU|nr:DNA-binding protein [Actinomycetospora straminea]MDD7935490.1 DNA-binding protein [Actinomycetospora straminea]